MDKLIRKESKSIKKILVVAMVMAMMLSMAVFATTTPTLNFDFDFSQMFTWTNSILSAMMPVVYITLGISLAFVILRALKQAFN